MLNGWIILPQQLWRWRFWVVLLVGVTDAVLSFLRVEGLHKVLFGEEIAKKLGISSWRGTYVHIPMMILAAFIGWRDNIGFADLADLFGGACRVIDCDCTICFCL